MEVLLEVGILCIFLIVSFQYDAICVPRPRVIYGWTSKYVCSFSLNSLKELVTWLLLTNISDSALVFVFLFLKFDRWNLFSNSRNGLTSRTIILYLNYKRSNRSKRLCKYENELPSILRQFLFLVISYSAPLGSQIYELCAATFSGQGIAMKCYISAFCNTVKYPNNLKGAASWK